MAEVAGLNTMSGALLDRVLVTPAESVVRSSRKGRVDWAAVERDYRTGTLTLREMAAKHHTNHETIVRRAKRVGWSRDLSQAVRLATHARLIDTSIAEAITSSQQAVTTTVLAAAELNKQVILSHRQELRDTRTVAMALLRELQSALPDEMESMHEQRQGLAARIAGIRALAEAITKLHAAERKAFNLDDDGPKEASGEVTAAQALRHFFSSLHGSGSNLPIARPIERSGGMPPLN